ncbi:hypothetical protein Poli38472_013972 [Pythium oligandrum]|uniref:Fatty acid hydroxylase domain-containing protein n=1 Tax=Pythium oligandrum TaxID=41045 RepID=A0A8K1FK21_PYTOL|nr:hypothetical protein Poli38472_013972 [Pythium oligandrum]|eukprot:TMW66660.1 hypothetical protein Poli38472_013972 [Pythium oligandrum]
MDLVLEFADEYVLDALYPPSMARDDLLRQSISVSTITFLGGYALYFVGASFSYYVLFDHNLMKHPRFLKNQVRKEITYACQSIPLMMVLIIPWFIAETRGYTMLYKDFNEYSLGYTLFSIVWFLFFTDMLIYWFHRWLHHRAVYAWLHKPHHKWIIPTPFASHAFHPLDGYIQGLPYHLFVVCFPLHRGVFLALYVFVNFWTISIHDGLHVAKNAWLNGAAHHSVHHEEFVYNYGQYFTFWDRLAGSYKEPEEPEAEKKTL